MFFTLTTTTKKWIFSELFTERYFGKPKMETPFLFSMWIEWREICFLGLDGSSGCLVTCQLPNTCLCCLDVPPFSLSLYLFYVLYSPWLLFCVGLQIQHLDMSYMKPCSKSLVLISFVSPRSPLLFWLSWLSSLKLNGICSLMAV